MRGSSSVAAESGALRMSDVYLAAWTLGHWIAAGALEQADVEDALYAAALRSGLAHNDGERQTWGTIRSGLGTGLQQPVDLDANDRWHMGRRSTSKNPTPAKLIDLLA